MARASLGVLDKNRELSTQQEAPRQGCHIQAKLVLKNNQLSEAGGNGTQRKRTQLLGILFANADTWLIDLTLGDKVFLWLVPYFDICFYSTGLHIIFFFTPPSWSLLLMVPTKYFSRRRVEYSTKSVFCCLRWRQMFYSYIN